MQLIKNFCIFLKAVNEWSLSIENIEEEMQSLFNTLVKVHDWINADTVLSNCFLNFIKLLSTGDQKIAKTCIMQEVNDAPLLKSILKKANAISIKPPHTENYLGLLRNAIETIEMCSHIFETRMMLKNCKAFQIFENLHPQLLVNKKTTWNDVVIIWLKLLETISRYDDTECSPR